MLKRYSVKYLSDLITENPLICAWSGGIRVLIDAIIDPFHADISENIVYILITFLNDS